MSLVVTVLEKPFYFDVTKLAVKHYKRYGCNCIFTVCANGCYLSIDKLGIAIG